MHRSSSCSRGDTMEEKSYYETFKDRPDMVEDPIRFVVE